jgi:N-acetylneuraminic acid mutarotase
MNQLRNSNQRSAMNEQTEDIDSLPKAIYCQPKARSGTRAISYRDSLYFFGGYTRKGGTYFNDLFQYNVVEKQWYELISQSNTQPRGLITKRKSQIPEARTDHTFVRYKNRFYVYGGRDEVQIFKDIH